MKCGRGEGRGERETKSTATVPTSKKSNCTDAQAPPPFTYTSPLTELSTTALPGLAAPLQSV
jgi:hypothetical protein